jgi:heme/copper-type cytochrome/quinol oxidase subunit 2
MRWSAPVIVFAVAAAMCAVAQVAILASVIRRRSSVVDSHVPRPRAAAEIVWAIVPAIALAFLLTATWQRVREHGAPMPADVSKVAP